MDMEKIKRKCDEYTQKMIRWRDLVVKKVFRHGNDNVVHMPVSFVNIIQNVRGQLDVTDNLNVRCTVLVDLDPLDAFELIELNFRKLQTLFYYAKPTMLFEIMYFFFLNPCDLIYKKKLSTVGLQLVLETVNLKFREALIHPCLLYTSPSPRD